MKRGWEYRVVAKNGTLAIHEVFFNSRGRATQMTEDPVAPVGMSRFELYSDLVKMKSAFDVPVFEPPKAWGVKR